MPKENKKRGPRGRRLEEKKRKAHATDADDERETKRVRQFEQNDSTTNDTKAADFISLDFDDAPANGDEQHEDPALEGTARPGDQPFYGMLDEDEQNYFRKADEMLDLNQFETPEERSAFLETLYRDAEGKELKLANSQSCSRLMERLIQLSTPDQLKSLFTKFSGNFIYLLQHRFASHCCEALFIQAAPTVTIEMQNPSKKPAETETEGEPVPESMETLFMNTLNELEEYLGFFMTQKWGSHALRVLLLVLAGEPITRSTKKGPLQSRKKEGVHVSGAAKQEETLLERRDVPEAFKSALEIFIARCVKGLNTDFLRALATHPTGNPTIQLLLQMELSHFGKQRAKDEGSIIHMLLPDDPIAEGTGSASFINGLVYDAVGSRLLETIIEFAPAKTFKSIYREFFKERLATLSRNDVASYVVTKVFTRLGKDELAEACEQLVPQIPLLVEKNRIALIRALIERCNVRGVPTQPIATQLESTFAGNDGFDIARLLLLTESATAPADAANSKLAPKQANGTSSTHAPSPHEKLHRSLLAQSMISTSGPLSTLTYDSLAKLETPVILSAATDTQASHTLTCALTNPAAGVIHRRKLIQQFYGHVCDLALDTAGSRVIDAVWTGTNGLAFIRERIAEELAESEQLLRASPSGRKVWSNWKMDLYKRRRGEWVLQSRESAGVAAFVGFPDEQQQQPGRANGVKAPNGTAVHNNEAKENGHTHTQSSASSSTHSSHTRRSGHRERDKAPLPPQSAVVPSATVPPGKHLTAIERARQKHALRSQSRREAAATAPGGRGAAGRGAVVS